MRIKKVNFPKELPKHNNVKLLDDSIENIPVVYFLFNKSLELLYIGQTKNFRNRLLGHISPRQSKSRYPEWLGYELPLGIVEYYSFIEIEDDYERVITELILIKTLKPGYNYKKSNKIRQEPFEDYTQKEKEVAYFDETTTPQALVKKMWGEE